MKKQLGSLWLAGALLLMLVSCATPPIHQSIWVKGEVKKGELLYLPWKPGMTAWEAIEQAGGVTFYAAEGVSVMRAGQRVFKGSRNDARSWKLLPNDGVLVMKD
jgi:hypothetical protein